MSNVFGIGGRSGLLLHRVEYQSLHVDVDAPLEVCYVLAHEVWEAAKLMQDRFDHGKQECDPRSLVRRIEVLYSGVYAVSNFLELISD